MLLTDTYLIQCKQVCQYKVIIFIILILIILWHCCYRLPICGEQLSGIILLFKQDFVRNLSEVYFVLLG